MKRMVFIVAVCLTTAACASNPVQDYLAECSNIEQHSGVYAIDIDFDAITNVSFGHRNQLNYLEYFNADQFDWEQMDSVVLSLSTTPSVFVYIDPLDIDDFNECYKAWIDNDLPYDDLLSMAYEWCIVTDGKYFKLARKDLE